MKAETALTSDEAKAAFKEFKLIATIYLHAAPGPEGDQILCGILSAASLSYNLYCTAATVRNAIRA